MQDYERQPSKQGSLTVVGTGIKAVSHITAEAEAYIRQADKVFYLVTDPVTEHWLKRLSPAAESLYKFYAPGKDRGVTYEEIIQQLMAAALSGLNVCCALYGHPSVFAYPGREAVKRLRESGLRAILLPAISAEDCLFADLGVDPGVTGCQSFEATDFLIHRRRFDPNSLLILWQVALIGVKTTPTEAFNRRGIDLLADYLSAHYGADHLVTIYEAAQVALCEPKIITVTIWGIHSANLSPISTLLVPPLSKSDPDPEIMSHLGLR